jgi:hypothetical protein
MSFSRAAFSIAKSRDAHAAANELVAHTASLWIVDRIMQSGIDTRWSA